MIDQAIERLRLFVASLRTRQGILGRAALGTPDPDDGRLADALADALAAEVRPDGRVGNAALPTIWRLHELLDLGRGADDPAVGRLLAWLFGRIGQPGAYGEGCDRVRHAQQQCEHFIRGFFAAAPPEQRVAPITLPTGKVFRTDPSARFALSCLGLRGALRAGLEGRRELEEHLASLVTLARGWTEWSGFFPPDAIVSGLHALALAGPDYRAPTAAIVSLVTRHQGLDGTWPAADLFGVLDALLAVGSAEAQRAVRRASTALAERQRRDGTFGGTAQQERAVIGLRALLWSRAGR